MSYPVQIGAPAVTNIGTSTDAVCTQPSGVKAGEGLLTFITYDGNGVLSTTTTGWVLLQTVIDGTSTVVGGAFWKSSAVGGGDATDSCTVHTTVSERSVYIAYRITGQSTSITPDITNVTASGTNTDPASITPTGGAKDYLFFVCRCGDGLTNVTTLPNNYSNWQTFQFTSAGSIDSVQRSLHASSEDPTAFTVATEQYICFTVAVHPSVTTADNFSKTTRVRQAINRSNTY